MNPKLELEGHNERDLCGLPVLTNQLWVCDGMAGILISNEEIKSYGS